MGNPSYNKEAGSFEEMAEQSEETEVKTTEVKTTEVKTTEVKTVEVPNPTNPSEAEMPAQDPGPGTTEVTE